DQIEFPPQGRAPAWPPYIPGLAGGDSEGGQAGAHPTRYLKSNHADNCEQIEFLRRSEAMRWKDLLGLVKETAYGWSQPHTFQSGAALAFYGAFALAPTLVIAIALAGIFFGEEAAKGRLDAALADALSPSVAQAVAEILTYVHVTRSGWMATLAGFGLVLFAATGIFMQLQMALNAIWGVQPKPGR